MTTDRRFRGRIVVAAVCAVLFTCSAARAQSVDSFDPGANGKVDAMAVQPDGKIVIGGTFNSYNGDAAASDRVMRLNADGTRDSYTQCATHESIQDTPKGDAEGSLPAPTGPARNIMAISSTMS